MNRNLLLIAVAAIAVVGVAVGMLLSGNGSSSPPLSGTIGPDPTILLSVSPCTAPLAPPTMAGALNFTLSGSLHTADGGPVPGRTVTFTARGASADHQLPAGLTGGAGSAVTAADGSVLLEKQDVPTAGYGTGACVEFTASFAGDAEYLGSESNRARKLC